MDFSYTECSFTPDVNFSKNVFFKTYFLITVFLEGAVVGTPQLSYATVTKSNYSLHEQLILIV